VFLACFLTANQGYVKATTESPDSKPLWTAALGLYSASTPTVSNGLVYVVSDSRMNGGTSTTLSCHNSTNGEELWNLTEQLIKFAISNGYIYTSYNTLQDKPYTSCLNASTGVQIWNFTAATGLGKPAVKDGVVYVGNNNMQNRKYTASYLIALNSSNGEILWRYTTPVASNLGSSFTDLAPLVVDNYVCTIDSRSLYVIDNKNGSLKWNYLTTYLQSLNYANGILYISRGDYDSGYAKGEIIAFNITSGEKLWSYHSSDIPKNGDSFVSPISEPVLANNVLLLASQNGDVTALNLSDGSTIWQYQLKTALWQERSTTTPVTSNNTVFVSSPTTVYGLKLDNGRLLWQYEETDATSYNIESYPTYDNGVVYVGLNTGLNIPSKNQDEQPHNFYALNAGNGKEIWHYTVYRNMLSTPAVDNGTVYFGGDSETNRSFHNKDPILYALKTATAGTQNNNANDYGNSWIFITSIVAAVLVILAIVVFFKKRSKLI
jgi:outer membrane protein assembly factor BamB